MAAKYASHDDKMNGETTGSTSCMTPSCDSLDYNNDEELRLVLIGRTGSGKSATGNAILGKHQFTAMTSGSSVTANSSRGETYRDGRLILVVDTPGLFDTNSLNFEVIKEIGKCVGMTSPGPHAVILVIGIGRYTKEEQETVDHFLQHFGEEVIKHMIIVFTRGDELARENKTIQEYLADAPPPLRHIVKRCKARYVVIDNNAEGLQKDRKIEEIISKIDLMVQANGGVCYTNELYQAAEAVLAMRMDEIRAEFEQDHDNWQLAERLVDLQRREHLLTQEVEEKENERLLLWSRLKKAKPSIRKNARKQVRDEVESKSPIVFLKLLNGIKYVGKYFLGYAVEFFTRKFFADLF